MESLRSIVPLIRKDSVMSTLYLQSAYYHVPIHASHQKYLRFAVKDQERIHHFQFRCLPFGFSSAPRIFTKLMAKVMAFLREKDILIIQYLDDFLLVADSPQQMEKPLTATTSLIQRLGWDQRELMSIFPHWQSAVTAELLGQLMWVHDNVEKPDQRGLMSITRAYYRNSVGGLLLFDITNRRSFQNVHEWLEEAKAHVQPYQIVFVLVGHKCDLDTQRQVTRHEAEKLATAYGMRYIETSARDAINVEKAFTDLTRDIYELVRKGEINIQEGWEGVKSGFVPNVVHSSEEIPNTVFGLQIKVHTIIFTLISASAYMTTAANE
ncbi:unnamed protein product [Ranitomeya imitator]|uniref:ribonuclease H n=1 Tax=Ranitomeya imitator TaxID=111125 RepID=A0ABN9MR41_9NEOB|nr:unnamed protein product [Ranitomeya imitator]